MNLNKKYHKITFEIIFEIKLKKYFKFNNLNYEQLFLKLQDFFYNSENINEKCLYYHPMFRFVI